VTNALDTRIHAELAQFKADGVYKRLNYLASPQAARVEMEGRGSVIILSSNNYLGLSNEPAVVAAGKAALDRYGAGTGSVRFICGTFSIHRELEAACARLVGTASALSFVSCWNANEAVPGTLLTEHDLILSDQLNHASIIDGLRLAKSITKCQTGVYKHGDLDDLRAKLAAATDRKVKMVITDGVFSMEGAIAKLPELAAICREHGALLVVDDSLTVRRVTQRLLTREGYRVALAKDGLDALDKLSDELPTVVLSDIEMPRMDGFDLVRNMRSDPRLAGLPVIMITSRIAQKHRDYAAELGVNHYLGKPYSEEELLALVGHYVQEAAAH